MLLSCRSHTTLKGMLLTVSMRWSEVSVAPSRTLKTVSKEEAFYFFSSIGEYTGQSATSLDEFLLKIKNIDVKSLMFHLYREDFERWVALTFGDAKLAQEIKGLRDIKVAENAIRDRLYFIVSRHLKKLENMPPV